MGKIIQKEQTQTPCLPFSMYKGFISAISECKFKMVYVWNIDRRSVGGLGKVIFNFGNMFSADSSKLIR